MTIAPFGRTIDGRDVQAITLRSEKVTATVLTFGAVLQDLRLVGVPYPLTLGAPSLLAYESDLAFFGSIVGPVANRIRDARASINGQLYTFPPDLPEGHTLHTGAFGLQTKVWEVAALSDSEVTLKIALPDGEAGLPGNRKISAQYSLVESTLTLDIRATSDAPTLMNPANHSYWNLDGTPTYEGHTLQVAAQRYCAADADLLPTGMTPQTRGTDFDFATPTPLKANAETFFDHNLCLSDARAPLRQVATLRGRSGVSLALATTEAGLQLYDGNGLTSAGHPTHTAPYGPYAGLALEAQGWPGATTHRHFPQWELHPGETYHQTTSFSFTR